MRRNPKSQSSRTEALLEDELCCLTQRAIGQRPKSVSCKFLNRFDLLIAIEGIETLPESLLRQQGRSLLAQHFRKSLNKALSQRIGHLVEQTTQRSVNHISISRQTDTEWLSLFVSLQVDTFAQSAWSSS